MAEAAQVAPCNSEINSDENTLALLKTFAWVEAPGENTYCTVISSPELKQQLGRKADGPDHPVVNIIPST